MLDFIDLVWGEFSLMPGVPSGDFQVGLALPSVLLVFNFCFSIYAATVTFKSRTEAEYNMLLACVVTTGCVNMVAAYMFGNIQEDWLGYAFTITLVADSLLNLSTAFRVARAYRKDILAPELPQYTCKPVGKAPEETPGYVWVDEKSWN
ncbi:hypothetical protein B0H15DRAFT_804214 [Mycena belliarum]|uniref:Uncharacterized protein n=1 Tax=Mycena belliarum TaxID=1033014 RepID=A0AAD6XHS7_9AGAR|nr:hypothetical protein B0H15DRAFT_804214 [Mycena belliae]